MRVIKSFSYWVWNLLFETNPANNSKCKLIQLAFYLNAFVFCFLWQRTIFFCLPFKVSFSLSLSFHITSLSLWPCFMRDLLWKSSITGCPLRRDLNKVTFNVRVSYARGPFVGREPEWIAVLIAGLSEVKAEVLSRNHLDVKECHFDDKTLPRIAA